LILIIVGDETCKHIIHLYHYDNHFCVITSMPAFFSKSFYCETCEVPYKNKDSHRCYNKCSSCYHSPPCYRFNTITCTDCNRLFKSQKCYENHKRKYKKDEKQFETEKRKLDKQVSSTLEKRKKESLIDNKNKKTKTNKGTAIEKNTTLEISKNTEIVDEYNLSICERFRRCVKCFKQFLTQKFDTHKCGLRRCNLCKQDVEAKGILVLHNK